MATRSQARSAVIAMLYAYDVGNISILTQAQVFLEERKIRHKQQDFALNLFNGVIQKREELDSCINTHLKEWDIARIGRIEHSILRLGSYELLFSDTDAPIVINEAIELSKAYGDDNAPKLINGVLDSIKQLRKPT